MEQTIAIRLKRLRAKSGLSVRKLAAAIGLEYSHYAYFEDPKRFKKPRLDLDLARKIGAALADYGVDQHEVMALAGIEPESIDLGLTSGEERLLDSFRDLTCEQRRLLQQMADQMRQTPAAAEHAAERAGATLHSSNKHYRPQPKEAV